MKEQIISKHILKTLMMTIMFIFGDLLGELSYTAIRKVRMQSNNLDK